MVVATMPRIVTASITSSKVKPAAERETRRMGAVMSAPPEIVDEADVVPRLLLAARDPDPHLAQIGKRRRQDLALPAQIRIAIGITLGEVAVGHTDLRERPDLGFGH